MKKYFFVFLLTLAISLPAFSQTARGIRIGYIDMEYILQNVPDYAEAKNQIELKAQKFKQDAETKKNEIIRLKEALKTERPLLTKELLEEREEEITFLETELSDFQQKKFGPTGELITQKAVLIKPIQDQVFTIVQDIADAKKYDFIFDKSSDMTMLFAQKRYDISDQVVRALTRTSKRNQLSKKELKEEAKKEYEENLQDQSPAQADRQRVLDERKAAREKLVADRKAEAEAKRNAVLAQRQAKKTGTPPVTAGTTPTGSTGTTTENTTVGNDAQAEKAAQQTASAERKATVRDSIANSREAARQATIEKRNKTMEDRKKALEEKKAKALADREAAKKAKEETNAKPQDSTNVGTKPKEN